MRGFGAGTAVCMAWTPNESTRGPPTSAVRIAMPQIRRRSGGRFDLPEGTVYPALHRLEIAGLLASDWVTPDAGRRKRVYTLTPAGTGALRERREGWAEFSRAVGAFLEPEKPWPA